MRISDVVRKCVGFAGIREGSGIRYGGTVFFINISEDGIKFLYMVTAKHVAEALEGSDCVIRVNNKQGRSVLVEASGTSGGITRLKVRPSIARLLHSRTAHVIST